MFKKTRPKLKDIIHWNGSRYKARFRQATAAIYFYLPKKHIPILFHSSAESGLYTAAILYLSNAASLSLLSWIIEPAASMVLGFFGSSVRLFPRN